MAPAASHQAESFTSFAADAVEDGVYAAKRAIKSAKRTVNQLGDVKDDAVYYVKRQPLKAVAFAAGAGLVLGIAVGWIGVRVGQGKFTCAEGNTDETAA